MPEAPLSKDGPIAVHVELSGPRTSQVIAMALDTGAVLTIRRIRCLGQTVRNLDVLCHNLPAESPVQGLLGLNFLRHFVVGLDFPRGRLVVKTPS